MGRQLWTSIRLLAVATVVLGICYPLALVGLGSAAVSGRADGSLVSRPNGDVVGSELIGQNFSGPRWFHSRPSAAGADGYDAMASGGSNLGPNNPTLVEQIEQRRRSVALANGVDPGDVPPDALTASGSGLDPHISPEYARIQIRRVAAANNLSESLVADVVARHLSGPDLGFIGEPRVNVLEINLDLQQMAP